MDFQALVLTPAFQPHTLFHWHESISAVLSRKVTCVEEYDEVVSSPSLTIQIPAVVVLRRHITRTKNDVKFSRANVYQRDDYRCQYCGEEKESRQLTYDHVKPRVQGGLTTWTNVVASCKKCNGKKGGRTPAQAGMHLLSIPVKPKSLAVTHIISLPRHVPDLWLPYLEGHRTMRAVG